MSGSTVNQDAGAVAASDHASALKGKVLKGFAWETSAKLIVQIMSWISTIMVARLLDPSDYGLATLAMLFTQFFDMIADMGLPQSLIHRRDTTREQEDGIFYLSVMLGVVLYAVLFFLAPLIAEFYKDERLVSLIRAVGLSSILVGLKVVPFGKMMQGMNFKYRATIEIISNFLVVLVSLPLAWMGYGVWTLIVANLVMHIVSTIAYLRFLSGVPMPRFRLSEVWGLFTYGMRIFASNVMFYFYGRSPTFIAGKFVSAALIGQMNLASSLASIPMDKIGVIFNRVGMSTFAQLKENKPEVRRYFLSMHRYLLILAYPILTGLVLVSHDLVTTLLTAKWTLAATLLQILCVGSMFKVSSMVPQYGLLLGVGRADRVMRFNLLGLFLIPTAAIIGVQSGLVVMVAALVVAYVPMYMLLMNYALKEMDGTVADLWGSAKPAILGSLFMAAIVWSANHLLAHAASMVRMVTDVVIGAASYVGFFVVMYREQLQEIKDGLALLRGNKPKAPRG